MPHTIKLVKEFHLSFGHPVEAVPTNPDDKTRLLRFRLIYEELMEFGRAIGIQGLADCSQEEFEARVKKTLNAIEIMAGFQTNLVEAADALGDIDYVTQGSNLVFGFPAESVVEEIHRANMSKLGADGKPIYDEHGKIQKGPNYRKPDVLAVLSLISATHKNWSGVTELRDDDSGVTGAAD